MFKYLKCFILKKFDKVHDHRYRFRYKVAEEATGDFQSRTESRNAEGIVTGSYRFLQPNGKFRSIIHHRICFFKAVIIVSPSASLCVSVGGADCAVCYYYYSIGHWNRMNNSKGLFFLFSPFT